MKNNIKKVFTILFLIIFVKIEGQTKDNFVFSIGEIFPKIELTNTKGDLINISSLNNNLILVDFWASWCKPCILENKTTFQNIFNKYKDKGFNIVSISFDTDKKRWKNTIQSDNMNWINLSDLKGFNSKLYKTFNIKALPTSFLINPKSNKILAINLRGEQLIKFLEYYYKHL